MGKKRKKWRRKGISTPCGGWKAGGKNGFQCRKNGSNKAFAADGLGGPGRKRRLSGRKKNCRNRESELGTRISAEEPCRNRGAADGRQRRSVSGADLGGRKKICRNRESGWGTRISAEEPCRGRRSVAPVSFRGDAGGEAAQLSEGCSSSLRISWSRLWSRVIRAAFSSNPRPPVKSSTRPR